MCHHCVTESVKARMLNRRDLFRGAATAGVAAAAVSMPSPLFAQKAMALTKVEDLTHELHEMFPTFFGEQQLYVEPKFTYAEHKFNLNEWRINEHTGTHVDAPFHFSEDGNTVGNLTVTVNKVGEGTVTLSPAKPTYACGEKVTLTANPANGWVFSGWSGDLSGTNPTQELTVTRNHVITATFMKSTSTGFKTYLPLVIEN